MLRLHANRNNIILTNLNKIKYVQGIVLISLSTIVDILLFGSSLTPLKRKKNES